MNKPKTFDQWVDETYNFTHGGLSPKVLNMMKFAWETCQTKNDEKIKVLKEMQEAHYLATKPMDNYFTGMYNGMSYALSIIADQEPEFKETEISIPNEKIKELENQIERMRNCKNCNNNSGGVCVVGSYCGDNLPLWEMKV